MQKKYSKSTNILLFQKIAIFTLALRTDILVVNWDLGPALIDTPIYVDYVFSDHPSNHDTYIQLTESEDTKHMERVAI